MAQIEATNLFLMSGFFKVSASRSSASMTLSELKSKKEDPFESKYFLIPPRPNMQ